MLSFKESVNGIKCLRVVIALPAFNANLGFHVLDEIQSAVKPVLFADLFLAGHSATKLAGHGSSVKAYTVMMSRAIRLSHIGQQAATSFLPVMTYI